MPGFPAWRSYTGRQVLRTSGYKGQWGLRTGAIGLWETQTLLNGHMQVLTCSKSQHTGNDLKGGLDIPPDLGGPTGTPPDNTDTGSSHSGELVSTMGALIWNPPSSLPTPGA